MAIIKTIFTIILKVLGVYIIFDLLIWAGIGIGLFADRYLNNGGDPRDAASIALAGCFEESLSGWKQFIALGKTVISYYL